MQHNKQRGQSGFTLIELTVVLLVLIGLAGALLPYVQGFVGRTHDATVQTVSRNYRKRFSAMMHSLPVCLQTLTHWLTTRAVW